MQKGVAVLVLFLGVLGVARAQLKEGGIYLSAEAYSKNELSFRQQDGKKYKIRVREFFKLRWVEVFRNDSVYRFYADSIYGFLTEEGLTKRIYKDAVYTLLNPGEQLILYSRCVVAEPKNPQNSTHYYFSKGASADIIPLSKNELHTSFKNEKMFLFYLEVFFHNNTSLISKEINTNQYKLNRVYELSQQQQN